MDALYALKIQFWLQCDVCPFCMNNINANVYPGSDKTAPALIDPPDVVELAMNCAVRIGYLRFLQLDERYIASRCVQGQRVGLCWRGVLHYCHFQLISTGKLVICHFYHAFGYAESAMSIHY